ncbi:O-antigen ligase family protein [Pseudomonas sp. TMP25]|uniref:O-antigen ligase family protein n=1 Tax=Pseudomonas sp. TMP25 TaxID=3136561 RepID=UPI0031012CBB
MKIQGVKVGVGVNFYLLKEQWCVTFLFVVMLIFCLAFYLPLTSKSVNNFYYVGIALPCLLGALSNPRALVELLKGFAWFFVLLLALVVINSTEIAGLKKWLYLFLFFMACVFLECSRWGMKGCFILFAMVSSGVFFWVLVDWLWIWGQSGHLIRYDVFFGERINPVYFSLLINSSLIFLWLFCVEGWLEKRSRIACLVGFFVLLALILLCSTIFQSRTSLLAMAVFLVGYALYRKMILPVIVLALLLIGLAVASGFSELLLRRGLSYRLDIWQDAWVRLSEVCGIWWGCGADDYRFLGKFYHAHSGYVALLYRNGLAGGLIFILLAALFLWRCSLAHSRWLLLALFGWGSLLTTTNGMLTSPQPLWIYCWLPTFMALLDTQKGTLDRFFAAREAV